MHSALTRCSLPAAGARPPVGFHSRLTCQHAPVARRCAPAAATPQGTVRIEDSPTNSLGHASSAQRRLDTTTPEDAYASEASTSGRLAPVVDLAETYLLGEAPLWDMSHVSAWSLGLALYVPFGCIIAAFRILLWCGGVLLDLSSFKNRAVINVWLALLGVRITWKHLERLPTERHVLVSNHRTPCDLLTLFTLPRRYVHLITTGMPPRVTNAQNLPVILRPATLEVYDQLASEDPKTGTPVHLFPEGGLTNGSGMMTFTRGFMKFAGNLPVVPVALRARTPFGLRSHTLLSSFPANLVWFSFTPWVELEATVLPPLAPAAAAGDAKGAYVQRAQQAIAAELAIPICAINIKEKRKIMQQQAAATAKK